MRCLPYWSATPWLMVGELIYISWGWFWSMLHVWFQERLLLLTIYLPLFGTNQTVPPLSFGQVIALRIIGIFSYSDSIYGHIHTIIHSHIITYIHFDDTIKLYSVTFKPYKIIFDENLHLISVFHFVRNIRLYRIWML